MAGGNGDALGNYLETRASTQISMQPHRETLESWFLRPLFGFFWGIREVQGLETGVHTGKSHHICHVVYVI